MRCTQVEKLLPLYMGGDLREARDASAVAAHLSECEACRRLSEEFEASRSLLALHTPPAFDDSFFAHVRRNVLREIEEGRSRPTPLAPFRRLFAPRTLAYAASLALLIACALVAFHFLPRRDAHTSQSPMTATREARPENPNQVPERAGQPRDSDDSDRQTLAGTVGVRAPKPSGPTSQTTRAGRHLAPTHAPQTAALKTFEPAAPPTRRASSLPAPRPALPSTEVAVNAPETFTQIAERKVTRIELQTSDPNVRIIWLSPQSDNTPATKKETKRR